MNEKVTIRTSRKTELPDSQVALYAALAQLAVRLNVWLEKQTRDPVFCRRCRRELPDRKEYCIDCEKLVGLEERVQKRIQGQVGTVGGTLLWH